MIEKINEQQFKELNDEYVLLDFYADWCGPCKMIAPFLSDISEEIKNVSFKKINIDENNDIATEYNVMSIPTLILFKKGREVKRRIGFDTKDNIKKWIKEEI